MNHVNRKNMLYIIIIMLVSFGVSVVYAKEGTEQQKRGMSKGVQTVQYDESAFKADPVYPEEKYDAQKQANIYSQKRAINTARPLLELGRPYLAAGPYEPGPPLSFLVYGDIQSAYGFNQTGDQTEQILGLRASLDINLKLSSTERLHALVRPFDTAGRPSQFLLASSDPERKLNGFTHVYQQCIDKEINPNGCTSLESFDEIFTNLFFEGEVATYPYAIGKIPHLLQNGIWLDDAYLGLAFSIASKHSLALDISNYDITFFAAAQGLDERVFGGPLLNGSDASLVATSFFLEMWGGYIEGGYGFILDRGASLDERFLSANDPRLAGARFNGDLSYHNATISFTRRYGSLFSNSIRAIINAGQGDLELLDLSDREVTRNANGFALLVESSLITSKPLTLVPYINLFVGIDTPQALSRQFGLLRNTGLLFEDNALTLQRSLFDNPDDSVGGAIGLEYLFQLDQQIVVEVAGSASICRDPEGENLYGNTCRRGQVGGLAVRDQGGIGVRYQLPFEIFKRAWILRADASYGMLFGDEDSQDQFGARLELRRKF